MVEFYKPFLRVNKIKVISLISQEKQRSLLLFIFLWSSAGGGEEIMKVMDGWLAFRRIMPSAERLYSKFHSFPQSFASRPDVHFSHNLAALGIILQYSSKPDRGLFVLKPCE